MHLKSAMLCHVSAAVLLLLQHEDRVYSSVGAQIFDLCWPVPPRVASPLSISIRNRLAHDSGFCQS
jgi:hypothetical protein